MLIQECSYYVSITRYVELLLIRGDNCTINYHTENVSNIVSVYFVFLVISSYCDFFKHFGCFERSLRRSGFFRYYSTVVFSMGDFG